MNRDCIIEIITFESILPIHQTEIGNYMKFAEKELGLLFNFNVQLLKDGIRRYRL